MQEAFHQWIAGLRPVDGVLACGVRWPDASCLSRSWSEDYPEAALDRAWRCVADTFHVLALNRLPAERVRWTYERALLYCERRLDGTCLGLFIARDARVMDTAGVAQLIESFHALS